MIGFEGDTVGWNDFKYATGAEVSSLVKGADTGKEGKSWWCLCSLPDEEVGYRVGDATGYSVGENTGYKVGGSTGLSVGNETGFSVGVSTG